jgi:hypothetical protein
VSRNFYYNEAQKYEVTDLIAAKENALREYTSTQGVIRKVEDTPYPPCDYDGIFEVRTSSFFFHFSLSFILYFICSMVSARERTIWRTKRT